MSDKKILFYCQNLLGLGHFVRTSEILRHLYGHAQSCLVFGGELVDGLDTQHATKFVALPALRRESGALKVVAADMPLEQAQKLREEALLAAARAFDPDVVVIEGFPFAKKALASELMPLLNELSRQRMKPPIFCSIRDVVLAKERDARKTKDGERRFAN